MKRNLIVVAAICLLASSGAPLQAHSIFMPRMIDIPAGCFLMGSPAAEPARGADEEQHRVCLEAFRIGRFEVTYDQYDQFAAATGRELPTDWGWGRGTRPVMWVSWHDATAYAAWLSEHAGRRFRLPTEAEWEYVARAGTTTPFWSGDCLTLQHANFSPSAAFAHCPPTASSPPARTVPAGTLPANPWGLHEILGNVWEWTCSAYEEDYVTAHTSCARADDERLRALRGGSWNLDHWFLRAAGRNFNQAHLRIFSVGFRLVEQ